MGAASSKNVAFAVLVPLPFIIPAIVVRCWIRWQRRLLGMDDWAMLANLPAWVVCVVSLLGMAWSGVGKPDATLSEQEAANTLMWFFVFQEFWCFSLVAIKWSLGYTLIRIAGKIRWVEVTIWTCLAVVTIGTGGTGVYLFFQCLPVQKNWHDDLPGTCQPRYVQTALSFMVAAISIATDWTFALLPMFLLWDVQMNPRVKLSVVALLGLGLFASVAPIVRLKYLFGMDDTSKFIENLAPILAWAAAEVNVGMLIANLPACRPLYEALLGRMSSSGSGSGAGGGGGGSRRKSEAVAAAEANANYYVELGRLHRDYRGRKARGTGGHDVGVETKMYGRELDGDGESRDSLAAVADDDDDGGSQRRVGAHGKPDGLGGQNRSQQELGAELHRAESMV